MYRGKVETSTCVIRAKMDLIDLAIAAEQEVAAILVGPKKSVSSEFVVATERFLATLGAAEVGQSRRPATRLVVCRAIVHSR